MRIRPLITIASAIAILAAFAAFPTRNIQASPSLQATAAAAPATKCADTKLVGMVAGDAKTLGATLSSMTTASTAADAYAFLVKVSDARIKYEDMDVPTDDACASLSYEAMVWFADVGNLGQVILAAQLKLDSANLDKRVTAVIDRLKAQTKRVTDLLPTSN